MKRLNKLKRKSGFTLAETLLAVLILLLVSGIVATGVPVARNVYQKVVIGANAQALLSTTVSALKDELGTAWDVSVTGDTVTYFSADTGARSSIAKEDNTIQITEYTAYDPVGKDSNNTRTYALVSDAASTKQNLYVDYDSVAMSDDGNVVTFSNLAVTHNGSTLASLDKLEIKVFSAAASGGT